MQSAVVKLMQLGRFPSADNTTLDQVAAIDTLLRAIQKPITDEEAAALCSLFGPDDLYELAWYLLHLIETAPGWPINACLENGDGEWIELLRTRARNGGFDV